MLGWERGYGTGVLEEVHVDPIGPERWAEVLDEDAAKTVVELAERGREALEGVTVWNVNSTARGGGVAEMLAPLVGEAQGAGVAARWVVINGDEEFFRVTKRIHNRLHGQPGDQGPLGDREREAYEAVAERNAEELCPQVAEGDVVILHDPQTAGLAEALAARGAAVVWRCHVGVDEPNDHAREAWDFLVPYLGHVGSYVFSRRSFACHEPSCIEFGNAMTCNRTASSGSNCPRTRSLKRRCGTLSACI